MSYNPETHTLTVGSLKDIHEFIRAAYAAEGYDIPAYEDVLPKSTSWGADVVADDEDWDEDDDVAEAVR